MRKYEIAIVLIGIIVVGTLAVGFRLIGSPVNQQAIRYDETRYNDFQQIKFRVESYYSTNSHLPASLEEVNYSGLTITDPETRKPYTLKLVDDTHYSLCTTFSTSAAEFKQYSSSNYYDAPITHTKGYSCVQYAIPQSMKVSPPKLMNY